MRLTLVPGVYSQEPIGNAGSVGDNVLKSAIQITGNQNLANIILVGITYYGQSYWMWAFATS